MKKSNFDDILWGKSEPKRKPVSQSAIKKVLVRAKGKCEKCKKSLDVTPHIHHKDGNPKNNKLTNLIVLCPNCHSKTHDKPKKTKRRNDDPFGIGFSL